MAGFDRVDPAIRVFFAVLPARVGRLAHEGLVGPLPYREMRARQLFEGTPVVAKYALHRRTGVVSKVRVLTS
jgi:hypothetical protein